MRKSFKVGKKVCKKEMGKKKVCVCVRVGADSFLDLAVSGYAMYTTEESSEDQTHGPHA